WHIPLYARRVIQDPESFEWICEVWDPLEPYPWTDADFTPDRKLFIYESHVGMATEEYRVGTYREFADNVLPRVKYLGYNTVQLMAIMEHPFYGSFGYQVSNFFAASSRFGYPEDLKYLVDTAHSLGIAVLLDVVHSHAVKNTVEGINRFDGTDTQFFRPGKLGDHPAWDTKCFNYGKHEVIHFLLSNLKFWMTEYHFDGFRFDGVTSMLYHDHGLGTAFTHLGMYFTMNTDTEAVTYLQLANELIREVSPRCITIAEDMSGMPGMCEKVADGGIGFDYRLGMGLPDLWIKLIKEQRDQDWNLDMIWHELTNRNAPTVAYVESHDQALVGDQTVMFRLAGAAMYDQMSKDCHTPVIDRAMALHKLIRLLTMAAGGNAYLNFMGNEFGHPEWIDFPRDGNGGSYHYCRRQWSLLFNDALKYRALYDFDHDMIHTAAHYRIFDQNYPDLKWVRDDDKVIAFERGGLVFVFNFSPDKDYFDYAIPVTRGEDHEVLFASDDSRYGGFARMRRDTLSAFLPGREGNFVRLYLPSRTCVVLKPKSL
ncbi:MAG: alpha amylase C-terminal domain-containing protein, partial [Clostridia bacterium]|nr:alpha amylase C-terminal domain-containing protein [Clostridia bacterium]